MEPALISARVLEVTMRLLILTAVAFSLSAQDHPHDHAAGGLGTVNFPISCAPIAQSKFNRAVALLHSFGYEEATVAFRDVAAVDPACGMAYWGEAMTMFHPIWAPPPPADLARGSKASAKAIAVSANTERERGYIAAVAAYYRNADSTSPQARLIAFREAMKGMHERYPLDDEAAIFYALAIRGTADEADKTFALQKQAAAILNDVLPRNPRHPGVAHYLIHSYDYPQLAELALPAARAYAKIAPEAPHALHMPTHIFTRLGLWDESVSSNLASAAAARARSARMHPDAGSFDELHADDYLVYAWLQEAQDDRAAGILAEMRAVTKLDANEVAAAYAFAASPARYALERRDWKAAAALKIMPEWFPWERFTYAAAIPSFARALGCARIGNLREAEREIIKLGVLKKAAPIAPYDWATQIEIQEGAARAWLTLASGDTVHARELARSAADLEDRTEKSPVTPGNVLPARELLGDMLLETNSPTEALLEYRAALKVSPRRFHSLAGAARSAELAGDRSTARSYYIMLTDMCKGSMTADRTELRQAKSFLNAQYSNSNLRSLLLP